MYTIIYNKWENSKVILCKSHIIQNYRFTNIIHTNKRNRLDETQLNKLISISTNSHLAYPKEYNFVENKDLSDNFQYDDTDVLREDMDIDISLSSS